MRIVSITICCLLSVSAVSQSLTELAHLPPALDEASGLETFDSNIFWTHNDDSQSILYGIDTAGKTSKVLHIAVRNRDWEDLAMDDRGQIYIGAIGNNRHNRKDLKIYVIPNPDSITKPVVMPGIIEYTYPDQKEFPPAKDQMNFDAEAMIVKGEFIYIFTKNWTQPFNGICKLYRIPRQPGRYTAELLDQIKIDDGPKLESWVTSADLSPDGTKLALLTHNKIIVFTGFDGDEFFSGRKTIINMNHFTQKEGLAFANNSTLMIVDERTEYILGGKLYKIIID